MKDVIIEILRSMRLAELRSHCIEQLQRHSGGPNHTETSVLLQMCFLRRAFVVKADHYLSTFYIYRAVCI